MGDTRCQFITSITLLFMFSMWLFVVLSFVLVWISRYTFLSGWLMLEQTIRSTFQSKHALLRSIGRLLPDPKGLMLWVLCKFVWIWSSWLAFCSSGIFSLVTIIFCINFFSIQLAPSNSLGILQRFLYASSLIAGDLASWTKLFISMLVSNYRLDFYVINLSYGLLHGRLI